VNCAETIQDRPGQPAYEMFGIKPKFQRYKVWPLGWRSPPYERIKFGYPLENVRFLLLSTNLAREWLQIDTDLLRIITSTDDELPGGTNIDDLERPWTAKIGVFSVSDELSGGTNSIEYMGLMGLKGFKCFLLFRLRRTLRVNFRWNILEIDQDNLRTKLNWCCRASHEH